MGRYTVTATGGAIVDNGTVSSTLFVPNLSGQIVTDVSVSILGLSHTFAGDLDMLLSSGSRHLNFLSDAAGSSDLVGANLTFSDSASVIPSELTTVPLDSGTYRPRAYGSVGETLTNWDIISAVPVSQATGDGLVGFNSVFDGALASNSWSLHIRDDVGLDSGSFVGWSLTLTTDGSIGDVAGSSLADFIVFSPTSATSGSYSTPTARVDYEDVSTWTINADAGNDVVIGAAGNDFVRGGTGIDQVFGGLGNDVLDAADGHVFAGETYDGGGGTDQLMLFTSLDEVTFDLRSVNLRSIEELGFSSFGTADFLAVLNASQFGGTGLSSTLTMLGRTVSGADVFTIYMGSVSAFNLSSLQLNAGMQGALDQFRVLGDSSNETITGSSIVDVIFGGAGNDVIESRAGNDSINGNEGNDTIGGGLGADNLNGGSGRDLAYFWDSTAGGVTARLDISGGNTGFAAGDALLQIEDLAGTNFADVLVGDATENTLLGSGGNDTLFGNAGNDTLQGGAGNDSIYGMAGNDLLAGEAGQDSFVFEGSMGATNVDRIIDFSSVDDTIVLENALFTTLANGNLAANQVAFGAAATLGTHRVIYNSATGQLFYDADGLGGTAQVHLATLNPGVVLALADFFVI